MIHCSQLPLETAACSEIELNLPKHLEDDFHQKLQKHHIQLHDPLLLLCLPYSAC
jgi:hypothetical protein